MGPPSYMRSVVDRNVVMRRLTVLPSCSVCSGHTVPVRTFDAPRSVQTAIPLFLCKVAIVS